MEIQGFPRQGLGGTVPDTADVLIGEVTLWEWRLHQTGRPRHHQLQDIQRFPPMDSLQWTHTCTHKCTCMQRQKPTRKREKTQKPKKNPTQISFCVFYVVLFLEPELLEENGYSMRASRGPVWGRLFIVWVCLQIYCADTSKLFFLPLLFLWELTEETVNRGCYSELFT